MSLSKVAREASVSSLTSPVATLAVALGALFVSSLPARAESFVNFESGQVRPLALSPDGTRLFALNTPDNRLEIFAVGGGTLSHLSSVSVGLEPVAVAARSDGEIWVVNHLSDSISIIDVAADPPRVTRTLLTCDEPRDIVFAGPGGNRAFVTTARRGQNCGAASNADLTTPSIGRAVVQMWDASSLGGGLRGNPLGEVILFGDTPRALARSADGSTVYAAIFHSGNQTTALNDGFVCDGGANAPPCLVAGRTAPGGLPAPNTNVEGIAGPEVGLIVRRNNATNRWEDGLGRDWSDLVRFQLPDLDVFAIDAGAALPVETASFAHVGAVLFNMAVNPVSGKVYVTNTEARNEVRFEGPAIFGGPEATTVQGHLHESRISVLDGSSVLPRHLNKHIDYTIRPAPAGVKERSLATPLDMAVSSDGTTLYVAGYGSSAIAVYSTAELEADTFVPSAADQIAVSGGGPSGLVLDEAQGRLYALTRFDNSIAIVDVATRAEIDQVPLHNPEPLEIVEGRPFLFDARHTSSNGEASCASCHVFGDLDSLGWDLGNPDEDVLNNPLPFRIQAILPVTSVDFHPLKGPMTTQSLRGMVDHGSMHWRGDRTGGNDPGGNVFDEDAAFKKFNPAFEGLLGRQEPLTDAEMQKFTDFILTVTYPPNPIRSLDQILTPNQQEGRDLFFGRPTDLVFNCNGCHRLDPISGFFGGDGFSTFEGETQMFKIPHLRNVYQKIGMFGRPGDADAGPQVRGFGVLHDGSIDTVFRFLGASVFTLTSQEQRRLEQFMFAFDSNFAPIVGQQATISSVTNTGVAQRVDLLLARADLGECDLVVKGTINGEARGGMRLPSGSFQLDRENEPAVSDAELRALAIQAGQEITYTCVPPGSGRRIGLDRDEDDFFDRDEIDNGTDPTDASDFPSAGSIPIRTFRLLLRDDDRPPLNENLRSLSFLSTRTGGVESGVFVPAGGSESDPSASGASGGGAELTVYRADRAELARFTLPASAWERSDAGGRTSYRYSDPRGAHGPIRSVILRGTRLSVRGKGAGSYALDGAPQGEIAVRLKLGTGVEYCAAAPPRAPISLNDTAAMFRSDASESPATGCPRAPL